MIHWRKKDFDDPPARLLCDNCVAQIRNAVTSKDGKKYTTTYYQDKDVLNTLRAYSINKNTFNEDTDEPKCFYCESLTETVATLQVEHYRPKAAIHDENNSVVAGTNGYYWLGCEWTNLVLACPKCNGRGAKGNKFPIKGTRVADGSPLNGHNTLDRSECYANGSPLIDEDPLLLHPEVDDIEPCFRFTSEGEIIGVGDKGIMSKEIYQLDRKQLNIARNSLKQELLNKINLVIEFNNQGIIEDKDLVQAFQKPCNDIIEAKNPERKYSLWAKYFNTHFEDVFVQEVPIKHQQPLRDAYLLAVK